MKLSFDVSLCVWARKRHRRTSLPTGQPRVTYPGCHAFDPGDRHGLKACRGGRRYRPRAAGGPFLTRWVRHNGRRPRREPSGDHGDHAPSHHGRAQALCPVHRGLGERYVHHVFLGCFKFVPVDQRNGCPFSGTRFEPKISLRREQGYNRHHLNAPPTLSQAW